MAKVTTRTFSWREVVERADDDSRHTNNLYPIAYRFPTGRVMRDSGPRKGIYED